MPAGGEAPRVFTVPPGAPLLDRLAGAILAGRFAPDGTPPGPLELPRYTVLVPTRRAARALGERFLAEGGGDARLLPQIRPLGDVDEEELALTGDAPAGESLEAAPAIAPLERELLLARLLLDWARDNDKHRLGSTLNSGPAQAVTLARSLARLIDGLETEELPLEAIDALADGDYPEHRRIILDFLRLVRQTLPEAMAERGVTGPAARRAHLLRLEADRLARSAPAHPVIAAGSTGSIPATARLLAVIVRLPSGAVVLPGLDRHLDADGWAALGPQHPQYGLRQLLGAIGIDRDDVADLGSDAGDTPRARLMSEVMRPSETTERWARAMAGFAGPALDAATAGLEAVEAPTPREEALAIALIMRRALETPGRTAALVTPDRRLAWRVAAELARWDVAVDDTAGTPLAQTPPGAFLFHVLDAVTSGFAPVELLTLLKHPLAAFGLERPELRRRARLLELAVLRGLRPAPGLDGLSRALKARRRAAEDGTTRLHPMVKRLKPADWEALDDLVARLESAFRPLLDLPTEPSTLGEDVVAHVVASEAAARDRAGDVPLWRHEAGESLNAFIAGLLEASDAAPQLAFDAYAATLRTLIAGRSVRPRFGRHPRLAIYGLLEARLIAADVMILGGLNEGIWPSQSEDDPWLNRPMRAEIGLPLPERRIGLAAHDFVQASCCAQVHLTWSRKIDGTPAVPSRWMLRLKALLSSVGAGCALAPESPWLDWAAALDTPERTIEIASPRPAPPVEARPRQLSVTRIEEWVRDPYAIFARYILRLEPLDPIDSMPGPAERGTLVHAALQRFAERHPDRLPDDAVAALMTAGEEVFAPWMDYPDVRGFWWPQYRRMARWFATEEVSLRAGTVRQWAEQSGRLAIDAPAGPFHLTGRADRIDLFADGTARLVDYKTGQPPSVKQVEAGLSPQLPLEAKMVAAGAFEGVGPLPVSELTYIRLTGGEPPGKIVALEKLDVPAIAEETFDGLSRLVGHYDRPGQAYIPRARVMLEEEARDYDHFSRFREWSATRASPGSGAP